MEEQLSGSLKSLAGDKSWPLPAWDGRYYVNYPEHEPDSLMGGKEGLKQLVKKAHSMGVKVILMFGGPNLSTFEFLKKIKCQMLD